jgi:hypothetical protein
MHATVTNVQFVRTGTIVAALFAQQHTDSVEFRLTFEHADASIVASASERYLPAVQAIQMDVPLAKNHPFAHCSQNSLVSSIFTL